MQHITNSKFYRGLLSLLKEQGNDSPDMRENLRIGLANLSEGDWKNCKNVANSLPDKKFWLSSAFLWCNSAEGHSFFWKHIHESIGGVFK